MVTTSAPPVTRCKINLAEERLSKMSLTCRGRLVRELVRGELPAGVHTVRWDGRSTSGGLRSNVYFYQLSAGGRTLSRKLLLIH